MGDNRFRAIRRPDSHIHHPRGELRKAWAAIPPSLKTVFFAAAGLIGTFADELPGVIRLGLVVGSLAAMAVVSGAAAWILVRGRKTLGIEAPPDSGLLLRGESISLQSLPDGPLSLVGLRPTELPSWNPVYQTDIGGQGLTFSSRLGPPMGFRCQLVNHGTEPVTDIQVDLEVEFLAVKQNETGGIESAGVVGRSRTAFRAQALTVGEALTIFVYNDCPYWARLIPPTSCAFKSRSMAAPAQGKLQVPMGFYCSLVPAKEEVKAAPPALPARSRSGDEARR